jgi:hypothetical protein
MHFTVSFSMKHPPKKGGWFQQNTEAKTVNKSHIASYSFSLGVFLQFIYYCKTVKLFITASPCGIPNPLGLVSNQWPARFVPTPDVSTVRRGIAPPRKASK